MANNALFLVCDMINDLVHEDGPNGKKGYGPILARRNVLANTAEAIRKARAAGVKIGYVRVGFSQDYRECPPTLAHFPGREESGALQARRVGNRSASAARTPARRLRHREASCEPVLRARASSRSCARTAYSACTSAAYRRAVRCCPRRRTVTTAITKCSCSRTAAPRSPTSSTRAVIEQMNRMTTIITSKDVTFAEGNP